MGYLLGADHRTGYRLMNYYLMNSCQGDCRPEEYRASCRLRIPTKY